jgi:hypothetical protein
MFEADERYLFDLDQVVELTPRATAEVASAAYKHAEAKAKSLRTKRDLKQAEARTYLALREEMTMSGSKPTEATLNAMVTTHPDVVFAEELYIEAECEYQLMKAELDSLADRAMGMKVLTSYVKKQIDAGL